SSSSSSGTRLAGRRLLPRGLRRLDALPWAPLATAGHPPTTVSARLTGEGTDPMFWARQKDARRREHSTNRFAWGTHFASIRGTTWSAEAQRDQRRLGGA